MTEYQKKKLWREENLGGRPPVFTTAKDITDIAIDYFAEIKGTLEPPTITGLCLFLGFESRQSFYDYAQKDGFSYTIARLRTMIECEYEKKLHSQSCTGAIFALKNMGWIDSQALDHTSGGKEMKGFTLNVKPDTE